MPDIVHWQEQLLTICRHSTGGSLQLKATNNLSAQICEQQCVPVNASVHLKALNVAAVFQNLGQWTSTRKALTHGMELIHLLFNQFRWLCLYFTAISFARKTEREYNIMGDFYLWNEVCYHCFTVSALMDSDQFIWTVKVLMHLDRHTSYIHLT